MEQIEILKAELPKIMKAKDLVYDLMEYADSIKLDEMNEYIKDVGDAFWDLCHIESSIRREIDRPLIEAYMEKHGCTESRARLFYRGGCKRLSD